MNLAAVRRAFRGDLPPVPVHARDPRWSVIHGEPPQRSTDDLVRTLLIAADIALDVDLQPLEHRSDAEYAGYVSRWPGEHYRLLAALVATRQPATIVEIGTYRGHGSLALLAGSERSRVVTYDIVPWHEIGNTALTDNDFVGGRLQQRIGDLADATYLESQLSTLRDADLLFVDGPKDGSWERRFCDEVLGRLTDRQRLVIFDDIRLMEMVQLWRDLPYPKLDATSLGHWSGTGLLLTTDS